MAARRHQLAPEKATSLVQVQHLLVEAVVQDSIVEGKLAKPRQVKGDIQMDVHLTALVDKMVNVKAKRGLPKAVKAFLEKPDMAQRLTAAWTAAQQEPPEAVVSAAAAAAADDDDNQQHEGLQQEQERARQLAERQLADEHASIASRGAPARPVAEVLLAAARAAAGGSQSAVGGAAKVPVLPPTYTNDLAVDTYLSNVLAGLKQKFGSGDLSHRAAAVKHFKDNGMWVSR